ncbi:APH(3'') family aminoglycoside O-phosphotransferase [Inquilinus sp.]|jgi:streptomycin 3"-kinase|uniref:APH(3'') family aminoglycoside O-phosphotransferase n=1 Tax=Inquilinus sp. TaxID=1932117 RepID=UPI003784EC2F
MNTPPASDRALLPRLPAGHEWLPVRHGESGDRVYRCSDGTAYAKLSTGPGDDLLEEFHRLNWLAPFGLGTPAVLNWRPSDDTAVLVTSAVRGVPASELSAADLARAWPSIVERIDALHTLPPAICPFERGLAGMFARAEDVVARDAVNPDFLAEEDRGTPFPILLDRLRAELPRRLTQQAADRVVCHGDACMPNLMVDPDTLRCVGLIDLGRLGTADRYVDLTLMLANARETWKTPEQAQAAHDQLFEILCLPKPDAERLAFYLRLDPLTWG